MIQVSSVKELSLRANPLGLYRTKHSPLMKLDPRWCTISHWLN